MKTKGNSSAWEKHHSFETGIERLQYVQVCFHDYVDNLSTLEKVKKQAQTPTVRPTKKKFRKRFFFNEKEIQTCCSFHCVGCQKSIMSPHWMKNQHFLNTLSPLCGECLSIDVG